MKIVLHHFVFKPYSHANIEPIQIFQHPPPKKKYSRDMKLNIESDLLLLSRLPSQNGAYERAGAD